VIFKKNYDILIKVVLLIIIWNSVPYNGNE